MPSITRRKTLLLLAGGAGLASVGAIAYAEPNDTPLLIVTNQTDSERSVTVTVRNSVTDTVLIDDTVSIPAESDHGFADLVAGDPLMVTIRTGDRPERTYRWTETAPENGLSVGITSEDIGFAVATPP